MIVRHLLRDSSTDCSSFGGGDVRAIYPLCREPVRSLCARSLNICGDTCTGPRWKRVGRCSSLNDTRREIAGDLSPDESSPAACPPFIRSATFLFPFFFFFFFRESRTELLERIFPIVSPEES